MNTYTYEVPDTEKTLKELIDKASESGVTITGDNKAGDISGMGLKGNYTVNGNSIAITVTDKPFIFPDSMIKTTLDKFMGK